MGRKWFLRSWNRSSHSPDNFSVAHSPSKCIPASPGERGDSRGSKGKDLSPEYCPHTRRVFKGVAEGARGSGWVSADENTLLTTAGATRTLLPITALPWESLLSLE